MVFLGCLRKCFGSVTAFSHRNQARRGEVTSPGWSGEEGAGLGSEHRGAWCRAGGLSAGPHLTS